MISIIMSHQSNNFSDFGFTLSPQPCDNYDYLVFLPYGSRKELSMIGRTKASLRNTAGGTVELIVNIAKGGNQSLLGL